MAERQRIEVKELRSGYQGGVSGSTLTSEMQAKTMMLGQNGSEAPN
jgi:hypothetical protein